jgi:DNA-binding NarL/FixJ family response regulator
VPRVGAIVRRASIPYLSGMAEVVRVLVVDDHRTFADLLARALAAEPGLECVAQAHTSAEAVVAVGQHRPDVVLMDLQLPDRDGIATTALLTASHPQLRVLILTAQAGPAEMARAAAAGAAGFLAKDGSLSDVLDAVRSAERGTLILPPSVTAGFAQHDGSLARSDNPGLTPRELQVLRLLGQGRDPRGIARELGVSLNTCRGYVKSILAKLEVHSQLEAVVVGTRMGLIPVERV